MNLATRLAMLVVEFDASMVSPRGSSVLVSAELWRQFVDLAKAELSRRNSAQRESKKAHIAHLARTGN